MVLWSDNLPLELTFKTLEFGVRGIVQRNAHPDALAETLRKVASAANCADRLPERRANWRSLGARFL